MKKKICILLACSLLAAGLSGCGAERTPAANEQNPYKNGTYNVRWASPDSDGYTEFLTVEMKNGQVTVVKFGGENADGGQKTDDEALKQAMLEAARKDKRVETYPQKFYPDIIASFNRAGGKVEDMETVAGATRSSNSFKTLLTQVLEANCTTGEAKTLEVPYYVDGEYKVTQPQYDENGYQEYVKIGVAGQKVNLLEYDAVDRDGNLRSADRTTAFPVAPQELASQLKTLYQEKGNVDDIEAVAGATRSTNSFRDLMNRALANAHFRGPKEDVLPTLKNGEYRAEMSTFDNGWKDYLVLTVQDDKVTIKELDSVNEKGELKSQNEQFAADMKAGNKAKGEPEIGPAEFVKAIISSFQKANDQVLDMENVAGATVSTNNFKLMAGILMGYNAKTGDETTVVVEPVGQGSEEPSGSDSPSKGESGESSSSSSSSDASSR